MFLLTEKQIDRTLSFAPLATLAPMLFVAQLLLLPHRLLISVLTLYGLFTLGVCGLGFRKWRSDSGLWMLMVLMLCSLIPTYVAFSYLQYVSELQPFFIGQRAGWSWKEFAHAIDLAIGVSLFQYQVRLGISVVIENWRRTRHLPIRVW
jgi:hypothetical protein